MRNNPCFANSPSSLPLVPEADLAPPLRFRYHGYDQRDLHLDRGQHH